MGMVNIDSLLLLLLLLESLTRQKNGISIHIECLERLS
jgi:hypothetical protein